MLHYFPRNVLFWEGNFLECRRFGTWNRRCWILSERQLNRIFYWNKNFFGGKELFRSDKSLSPLSGYSFIIWRGEVGVGRKFIIRKSRLHFAFVKKKPLTFAIVNKALNDPLILRKTRRSPLVVDKLRLNPYLFINLTLVQWFLFCHPILL